MAPAPTRPSGRLTRPVGRLTRRSEFLSVAKGRRFHSERVTVQARPRDGGSGPDGLRFGFTVTKREGHATERNRIRRRLRVAAAQAGGAVEPVSFDIVVIGRRPVLHAPFADLQADLARALRHLLRPRPAAPSPDGPAA